MQIIFRATTATTVAAGGTITTNAVQLLPQWAPPIAYVGTTDPWHVVFIPGTTMADGGFTKPGRMMTAKVRAYGRRSTLHSGRECFATSRRVEQQYGSARPLIYYVFTYRAVGELSRP